MSAVSMPRSPAISRAVIFWFRFARPLVKLTLGGEQVDRVARLPGVGPAELRGDPPVGAKDPPGVRDRVDAEV